MEGYELGKDIQLILTRLQKIEAALVGRAPHERGRTSELAKPGTNPLFGVEWGMAKAESLFSSSFSPEGETRLYEGVPGGYRLSVKGTHNGKPYSWGYTAIYDGKDHPVWGRPDADSIEAYRINDRITIGFFKKNGVPCGPYTRKVSADGKSLQVQTVGRNADGSVYFDVIEYKRPE